MSLPQGLALNINLGSPSVMTANGIGTAMAEPGSHMTASLSNSNPSSPNYNHNLTGIPGKEHRGAGGGRLKGLGGPV